MKISTNIMSSIYLLCVFNSCTGQNSTNKDALINPMLKKEITLIKTIPGGSRAHIIYVSQDGELSYYVGAVSNLNNYSRSNDVIDENYRKRKISLDSNAIVDLNNLLNEEQTLLYTDKLLVKDNWQYYLYLNGEKKSFGYENNLNEYPVNLRRLIDLLLSYTGKFHKIAGMS